MPFTTGNPGRPKGAKNRNTSDLRDKINNFLVNKFEDIELVFDSLKGREQMEFYIRLLSFGLPTLKAVEHTTMIKDKLEQLTDEQLEQLVDEILNKEDAEEQG